MRVIYREEDFRENASVVALGMFDGVHIGHQKLIRETVRLAKELGVLGIVCTFDRHPLSVIRPESAPKPLLTLEENLKKFEQLGADYAFVKSFTKEFAAMQPEDFISILTQSLHAKVIVTGENYTFGCMGKGNAELLHRLSGKYGYRAVTVESVKDGEQIASSTYIRTLLSRGETEHAARLLQIQ